MTLVADDRGRIPFAFLGALLLLSSSFYAVSLAPPQPAEPVADELVTDTQVEARLAMDAAIRDASRAAAGEPVLVPSESGVGSVVSEDRPFKDALELRIASGVREAVRGVNTTRDGYEARITLPPIRDEESARTALEGVSIDHVAAERYRVRIENLQVSLLRHGTPVDSVSYNATLTMALPSIELHERTNRYESRLNAGLTEAGLSQGLTARVFPIVWMRGYAQYGGAPIKNVLANRHVEVMANDAMLAQQAAVFGIEDPEGRNGTTRAAAAVATRDAFLGAEETVKSQLSKPQGEPTGAGEPAGSPNVPIPGVVDNKQSVDAEHQADEAYLDFVEGRDGRGFAQTIDAVYQADVRVESSASRRGTERDSYGSRPTNGTRLFTDTNTDRWHSVGDFQGGHGSTLQTYRGTVIEETVRTTYWATNRSIETTRSVRRTTYAVRLDLESRYQPPGIAPGRPEPSFPFGPVATDRIRSAGTDRLLTESAAERRAVKAIQGGGSTGWQTVDIEPPNAVTERAEERTAELRRTVKDVSVSLETRSIASSTNPASQLAKRLEGDRSEFLDTPGRYDSAADRAVAAARVSYFHRVTDALHEETSMVQEAQSAVTDKLNAQMVPSGPPERSTPSSDDYVSAIDGGPAYLSLDPPGDADPALAARNVNLFTVPYGDTADAITEGIGSAGGTSVSIRTAAQTLAVLEKTDRGDPSDKRALRRNLDQSLSAATHRYRSVLAESIDYRRADRIVRAGASEWPTVHERALAFAEGDMAESIAEELPRTLPTTERDRLEVALRMAGAESRADTDVRVDESLVETARMDATESASPMVAESAKAAATEGGKQIWKSRTGTKVGSLPAGLPLLPMPGSWYVTVNAWTVSVEGTYDRFEVATRRAAPGRGANGTVEYVRENATVRADIDGDGLHEILGHNRAISFEARTGVVIVVPPGKTGVGDVDGQAIETSPGW